MPIFGGIHKDDWEQFGNISDKKKKLSIVLSIT